MALESDFLNHRKSAWKRLQEAELVECNEQEKALVRGLEGQAIEACLAELSELVHACRNRFAFAKTYKVLRAGHKKVFADSAAGNPKMPEHVNRAVRRAFMQISERKLQTMADWFYIALADEKDREKVHAERNKGNYSNAAAIEVYAGKDEAGKKNESGCGTVAVMLLVAGAILALMTVLR